MDAWRNVEVNKGYQAIGVIRQKSNASNSNRISIIDMSKPSDRSEEHTEKKNESKNDMEEKKEHKEKKHKKEKKYKKEKMEKKHKKRKKEKKGKKKSREKIVLDLEEAIPIPGIVTTTIPVLTYDKNEKNDYSSANDSTSDSDSDEVVGPLPLHLMRKTDKAGEGEGERERGKGITAINDTKAVIGVVGVATLDDVVQVNNKNNRDDWMLTPGENRTVAEMLTATGVSSDAHLQNRKFAGGKTAKQAAAAVMAEKEIEKKAYEASAEGKRARAVIEAHKVSRGPSLMEQHLAKRSKGNSNGGSSSRGGVNQSTQARVLLQHAKDMDKRFGRGVLQG